MTLSKINYYELTKVFIRTLRGSVAQRELSQKLGFSFKQVGKWESGVAQIKWENIIDITNVLGLPFEKYLDHFLFCAVGPFDIENILALLDQFYSLNKNSEQLLIKK